MTPPEEGILSEAVADVAEHMIHPEDSKRFLEFFDLDKVYATLESGKGSVIGEFRKLWVDGDFHWASLTVFPAVSGGGEDEILLCFIMDIGYKKQLEDIEKENESLQKKQMDDERYRLVIEQTNTLVFEWIIGTSQRYYAPVSYTHLEDVICLDWLTGIRLPPCFGRGDNAKANDLDNRTVDDG